MVGRRGGGVRERDGVVVRERDGVVVRVALAAVVAGRRDVFERRRGDMATTILSGNAQFKAATRQARRLYEQRPGECRRSTTRLWSATCASTIRSIG